MFPSLSPKWRWLLIKLAVRLTSFVCRPNCV